MSELGVGVVTLDERGSRTITYAEFVNRHELGEHVGFGKAGVIARSYLTAEQMGATIWGTWAFVSGTTITTESLYKSLKARGGFR